jgi:hypothetical protein
VPYIAMCNREPLLQIWNKDSELLPWTFIF